MKQTHKLTILLLFLALMIVPALTACQSGKASQEDKTSKTSDPVKTGTEEMVSLNNKLQKALEAEDVDDAIKYGKAINTQWLSYENDVRDRFPLQYARIERYQQPIFAQSNVETPNLDQMKENSDQLKTQLSDLLAAKETKAKPSKLLDQAVEDYQVYVNEQMDQLVKATEPLAKAVEDGDIDQAKKLYAKPRIYYERVEPIAESFGDLDPRIDARINDVEDPAEWSGFHKIEKALWEDKNLDGQKQTAEQLVQDVKELQEKARTFDLKPKAMVAGAMGLLEEAATSKITGEEERYAHIDLLDLQANVDGSQAVYQSAIPALNEGHKELAKSIDKQFQALNNLLLKYKKADDHYASYETLSKDEIRAISNELSKLSELMAQTAQIF